VAPLSTVPNWVKEVKYVLFNVLKLLYGFSIFYFFAYFRKFAPELPVVLYHGSQAERQELRSKHLDEVHIIKVTNEPFRRHKHCIP
jgi:hypothetical protein